MLPPIIVAEPSDPCATLSAFAVAEGAAGGQHGPIGFASSRQLRAGRAGVNLQIANGTCHPSPRKSSYAASNVGATPYGKNTERMWLDKGGAVWIQNKLV